MEEAEELCDRVGIIDHGKLIARGKPKDLIAKSGVKTSRTYSSNSQAEKYGRDSKMQVQRILALAKKELKKQSVNPQFSS